MAVGALMILEVNDAGEVILPAELVQAAPHTQLVADRRGNRLVLRQVAVLQPQPSILTLPVFHGKVSDPCMTFRREDMYEDDGR